MSRSTPRPVQAADRPLTPQNLLGDFGVRTAPAREAVQTLLAALNADGRSAMRRWQACFGRWAGRFAAKPGRCLARLAGRYGLSDAAGDDVVLLFAVQTYYATLVKLLAERFGLGRLDAGLPDNPFRWCESARSKAVGRLTDRLRQALAGYRLTPAADDGECDLLKPLYQDLFPRALRHQLGEYYTPDWLAAHVLDQAGYTGEPGQRLLDPACGSGTFLLMALRRLRMRGEGRGTGDGGRDGKSEARNPKSEIANSSPLSPLPSPLLPIVGFDLNPLAVMTARANYLIAAAGLPPNDEPVQAPIYLRDSIVGGGEDAGDREQFDFVVGNPPWIAWDNLPEEDRRATKPLWERYGLFSLSGSDARHGGGKKDLAMLMVYAAADRYLKPGGRLGMVVTQTLFQSRGAGDGFRRFQLGADGLPLGVLRVDDMVALRPFGEAANWTSTIVLERDGHGVSRAVFRVGPAAGGGGRGEDGRQGDKETGRRGEERDSDKSAMATINHQQSLDPSSLFPHPSCESCLARPIDPARPTSPWLVETRGQGSGVRGQGSGVRDQGSGIRGQGAEQPNPKSEIRNPKYLFPDLRPVTSGPFYSCAPRGQ